jgi:hypothetical protein
VDNGKSESKYEGPRILPDLYFALIAYRKTNPLVKVSICAHEAIEYGHIITIYTECIRAEISEVAFEMLPAEE